MNFQQAKMSIEAGNLLDFRQFTFDINDVETERGRTTYHESKNFDNEFTDTTSMTLLHVAIKTGNIPAITQLIAAGADTAINFVTGRIRKQRMVISGDGNDPYGRQPEWSDWEESKEVIKTVTTEQLAADNADILDALGLAALPVNIEAEVVVGQAALSSPGSNLPDAIVAPADIPTTLSAETATTQGAASTADISISLPVVVPAAASTENPSPHGVVHGVGDAEEELDKGIVKDDEGNRYKRRLYIGEGNFSGIKAVLEKHVVAYPGLKRAIIASDIKHMKEAKANIDGLRKKGVLCAEGIDATSLDKDPLLSGKRFRRIHWVCPHTAAGESHDFKELSPLLSAFFKSAQSRQCLGDRIHIVLAVPKKVPDRFKEKMSLEDYQKFYQAGYYNIHENAASAGYQLIYKHKFSADRYPGYMHIKSEGGGAAEVAEKQIEYVFKKSNCRLDAIPKGGVYTVYGQERSLLVKMTTDEDSSDYKCESDRSEADVAHDPSQAPAP